MKKVLVPAVEKAMKNPEGKAKIEKLGYVVEYKSPARLRKVVMEDYETANAIAARLGFRASRAVIREQRAA